MRSSYPPSRRSHDRDTTIIARNTSDEPIVRDDQAVTGLHASARIAAAAVTTVVLLGGCAEPVRVPPRGGAEPTGTDPTVINFAGTHGARWGQTLTELTTAGEMAPSPQACGPQFVDIAGAGPVFENDRLVLIWANPPLHTPENVMVGTPVSAVRVAYPGAVALPSTPGLFAALIVANGLGQAYLILHGNANVQKLIVGVESAARRLYASRMDTC
jgi:hypothetical protein